MRSTDAAPKATPKLRADYSPPPFAARTLDLVFELAEDEALVTATTRFERQGPGNELVLNGEELETLSIRVDGEAWPADQLEEAAEVLTLRGLPDAFTLETRVRIHPESNTSLSGLYRSSGNFCTQCEAEGFRRITWSQDRPDVMAVWSTTILAQPDLAPVLLSNGNKVADEVLEDGRRRVRWEDPWPKPSYLFALVAGDLVCHAGTFTTCSGREVALEIWVEPQNADACEHALQSLVDSMRWDEEVFGLEYDLDVYMIVAVNDFNMGAMENKGLNVFNSKYVLARPETATDDDYEGVQSVIAHEYFHNWTGNRVTCRDWFQLTLKEGLTVYRDQRFSADMNSAPVERIGSVRGLRNRQYPEDAGPLAHPIRPESYVAMDNFYTATVYQKGAEVIRMYEALLGTDGFRRGMDLYFERHDGQAVTCDDFRSAMADANGRDLAQFEQWYLQPGTPRVAVTEEWDASAGTFSLVMVQSPGARAEADSPPLHIPIRMGLLGPDGTPQPLRLAGDAREAGQECVLELTAREQVFTFEGLSERPVVSLFRGASAPVLVEHARREGDLAFLMAHDADPVNRWEAGQTLARALLLDLAAAAARGEGLALPTPFVEAFRAVVTDEGLDGSMRQLMLALPTEHELAERMEVVDPDALFRARTFVREGLGRALEGELRQLFERSRAQGAYRPEASEVDRRREHHAALAYLCAAGSGTGLAKELFDAADNMSDAEAALGCLVQVESPERAEALAAFHSKWRHNPLVLDKWFALQASCRMEGAVDRIEGLLAHEDFQLSNPNRARSVLHTFAASDPTGFHAADGSGYRLIGAQVSALDALNPQVAARLAGTFSSWRRFDPARQAAAREALEGILARDPSRNVREVVERTLA
jgi:aminopeptidase N